MFINLFLSSHPTLLYRAPADSFSSFEIGFSIEKYCLIFVKTAVACPPLLRVQVRYPAMARGAISFMTRDEMFRFVKVKIILCHGLLM